MRKYLFTTLFLIVSCTLFAQKPLWGFNSGSTTNDAAYVTKVAPNGNICVAGRFSGTMDLDPGLGVTNITGSGLDDIYLACYSPSGALLWGFGFGGSGYDAVRTMTFDAASNVIIGGYIQSGGIDFDPGTGSAILPYAGGSGLTYFGDGFVAKYSSTGVYQWAYSLGGFTVYDHVQGLGTDAAGNVYVTGEYDDVMTIPGGPTLNSGTDGQAFLIKYTPAGTVVWAHSFGMPGTVATDTEPHDMKISGGFIYIAGLFQGTCDFSPWATSHIYTSVGYYDAFIAKYDVNGNYVFAYPVSGSGYYDNVYGMALDASDNIYISGITNSASMTFDPSAPLTSTVAAPGGGTSNYDIFIAKYNSSGKYQWGNVMGSAADDAGWGVDIIGSNAYFTGSFSNTVDFDPSTSVSNLVSNGGTDAYIAKYDLNGNYICGFNIGDASTDDAGYGLHHDAAGNLFACGEFGGVTVDFDPTSTSFPLTSVGMNDAYLVKYDWTGGGTLTGYATGDTICSGKVAYLTITVTTGGAGPFTVTYTDGTTTFTQAGVSSGVPFALSPSPTVNTTYTITTVIPTSSAAICTTPVGLGFGATTVLVYPASATITQSSTGCNAYKFTLSGSATSGTWNFGDGTTDVAIPTVTHAYTTAGTFPVTFKGITANGCPVSDVVPITAVSTVAVNIGPDTVICEGTKLTLQPARGYPSSATYLWSTGSTASSIDVSATGTYWLNVSVSGCDAGDTMHILFTQPPVVSLGNDTTVCSGDTLNLTPTASGSALFLWSTGSTARSIEVATAGTYMLTVTAYGCSNSDTVNVRLISSPVLNFGEDTTLCFGEELLLQADVANGDVSWSNGTYGPSIRVTEAGTYYATIFNKCGSSQDTVTVQYEQCDIWFPNAFTPNGDNRNDIARAVGFLQRITDYTLAIFNRFGQQVFITNDVYAGWDGVFNNVPQEIGVYYYYMDYHLSGKKGFMKGDITLIR